jgi:RHS repeat-associated protein
VGMRQGNEVYWLHGDHLGSASLTTNITGAVVSEMRYYPFGETRWVSGTLPTDRLFTGQRIEARTGLYDYDARMYSPSLGRFVSADTVVPHAGDPQSLNRYSYVNNRPLNLVDPSGHCGRDPNGNEICTKESSTVSSALVMTPVNLKIEAESKSQTPQAQWVIRSNDSFDVAWIKSSPGGVASFFAPLWIASGAMVAPAVGVYAYNAAGHCAANPICGAVVYGISTQTTGQQGESKSLIDANKFNYFFGRVTSSEHNAARSNQMALVMKELGVPDNASGYSMLGNHFTQAAQESTNVVSTYTQAWEGGTGLFMDKESLFQGPSGMWVLWVTTWQVLENGVLRLTTAIPKYTK